MDVLVLFTLPADARYDVFEGEAALDAALKDFTHGTADRKEYATEWLLTNVVKAERFKV